jgi:hypothetical protein
MRKFLEIAGLVAGVVLIAFGVVAIVMGVDGRSTVRDSLKQEQIVGSADMTPTAIRAAAREAGLSLDGVSVPTLGIAGKPINTGERARAFAGYMRIHALESSGGLVYAQMGRFAVRSGDPAGTSDEAKALKDENGKPVANAARNTWVTETALSTALNVSYMAEQLALFGVVVGVALLLSGIGFMVLAIGGTLRSPEPAFAFRLHRKQRTAVAGTV